MAREYQQLSETEPRASSKRMSLMGLGADMLGMVLDSLSIPDTKSMSLVNSFVYDIARYRMNRGFKLDTSQDGIATSIERFDYLEKERLLPAVRSLDIVDLPRQLISEQEDGTVSNGSMKPYVPYDRRIAHMCRLILSMPGLQ